MTCMEYLEYFLKNPVWGIWTRPATLQRVCLLLFCCFPWWRGVKSDPACMKYQSPPHPAILRYGGTCYKFSLGGMKRQMETEQRDLAGRCEAGFLIQPLPSRLLGAHLWTFLFSVSLLLPFFFSFPFPCSHIWWKPCPAPIQPPSSSPLRLPSCPLLSSNAGTMRTRQSPLRRLPVESKGGGQEGWELV